MNVENKKLLELFGCNIGDEIRAKIIGRTNNHFLQCNGGFKFDLRHYVTIIEDERGVLMAGKLSLVSYLGKQVEIKQNKLK